MAPLRKRRTWGAFAVFGGLSLVAMAIGGAVTMRPKNQLFYARLPKPRYTPPAPAFGVVWPVLYGLSAASATRVWRARPHPAATRALALWATQLVFNAAWTPIFFGAHRPRLALADLVATLGASVGYAAEARKVDRTAAWLVAPYLAWLGFAGVLTSDIVARTRS